MPTFSFVWKTASVQNVTDERHETANPISVANRNDPAAVRVAR
ncbi:hypothetical protein EV193_106241 [Herbihabitans rhizosphaerae]|uniref:Uncharacterized protein n=1 Tax=Herbihabitans rhizosphaerae TaxID=1872711 RepID=A0A4Q7KL94_9PSEU|nr:hypothetical protein EV193_106241 [Herbihabitans rhizosphaerae]